MFLLAICLLITLSLGARRRSFVVLPSKEGKASDVACNVSTRPSRSRSTWCEREGVLDQHITFRQIQTGYGLCLDGQCYDGVTLRQWLRVSERLPHSRAPFSSASLTRLLLGIDLADPPYLSPNYRVNCEITTGTIGSSSTSSVATFTANASLNAVAFGKLGILTGGSSGMVQLWSLGTFRELQRFSGHESDRQILSVKFSPDGQKLVTASDDKTARLWNARTGEQLWRFEGHYMIVTSVAFSPNGTMVLSGSYDGTARLWDCFTGRETRRLHGHGFIVDVAFRSPSGREVFVAAIDGMSRRWDIVTGRALAAFPYLSEQITFVSYSPDGAKLLTSADVATVWDVESGRELLRIPSSLFQHGPSAFSPDGRFILTSCEDCTVQLRNVETGAELKRFGGHSASVSSAAFSPDGQQVVTVSGASVRVFDCGGL